MLYLIFNLFCKLFTTFRKRYIFWNYCDLEAIPLQSGQRLQTYHNFIVCSCQVLPTYQMQQHYSRVNASKLLLHVCSVTHAKYLQHPPCKMFVVFTLQMFAVSTLQIVCSIHPAKCLQHTPCKIFVVSTLQNVCSIHPAKCLQYPPCKLFAASTMNIVCSILPAKCMQHPSCKNFAACTLQIFCFSITSILSQLSTLAIFCCI